MMDDLISRQAALNAIERLVLPKVKAETMAGAINYVAWRCAITSAEEMIVHLPPAERRGKWIPHEETTELSPGVKMTAKGYICSECGERFGNAWTWCGNCGARMERSEG